MCLLERLNCLVRVLAGRVEDHPDDHLAGLDHGLVAVLQYLGLLHDPLAEPPVQQVFGRALELLLVFLIHHQLLVLLEQSV